jgi:ornithine cyclodeaminase/alanine dehydrogenase-like protein (mu-crystallin family)
MSFRARTMLEPSGALQFAYFSPAQVRAALSVADVIEPVGRALVDFSQGLGEAPLMVFAPAGPDGDVHVKAAWLPGRPIFTVKIATWFAAAEPSGGGLVGVFDATTGALCALVEDDHHISDVRTAAAGALATRLLSRSDSHELGVIGTGTQAYLQVLAAVAERPIRSVRIWGRSEKRAEKLALAIVRRCRGVRTSIVATPRSAVEEVDILVTATASREPIVEPSWLSTGTHVTAVGADDPHKCELAPGCLERADVIVVDSRELALGLGDIRHAVGSGAISPERITAELGELLGNPNPPQRDERAITICKLVGLGVQDLAAAEVALERLQAGTRFGPPPASAVDLRSPRGG